MFGSMIVIANPAGAATTFAAVAAAVTCATTRTTACQSYTNSSSGIAVLGTSAKGTGVRASSTSNYGLKSTSSTGSAIFGQVTSSSSNDSVAGVIGTSPNGYGVYGYTNDSIGVFGATQAANAIPEPLPPSVGIAGAADTDGVGVFGVSDTGTAIAGSSDQENGGDFSGDIGVVGRSNDHPIVATDLSGNKLFYVDGSGNVFLPREFELVRSHEVRDRYFRILTTFFRSDDRRLGHGRTRRRDGDRSTRPGIRGDDRHRDSIPRLRDAGRRYARSLHSVEIAPRLRRTRDAGRPLDVRFRLPYSGHVDRWRRKADGNDVGERFLARRHAVTRKNACRSSSGDFDPVTFYA